jgi:glucosylceramidase
MNIKLVTTTYQNGEKNTTEKVKGFITDNGVEMKVVNLYPEMEYQVFD